MSITTRRSIDDVAEDARKKISAIDHRMLTSHETGHGLAAVAYAVVAAGKMLAYAVEAKP